MKSETSRRYSAFRGVPNHIASSLRAYGDGAALLRRINNAVRRRRESWHSDFELPNLTVSSALQGRLDNGTALLKAVDTFRREADSTLSMSSIEHRDRRALNILTAEASGIGCSRSAIDRAIAAPAQVSSGCV